MSEEPVVGGAAAPTEPPSKPFHLKLQEQIKEVLAGSSPKVRELVVSHLTVAEIERRKDAVLFVLTKLSEQQKNIRKLEDGGTVVWDRNGNVTGPPTFTKDQLKTIKDAQEAHNRLQAALAAAFEKNEWPKLLELSKQN